MSERLRSHFGRPGLGLFDRFPNVHVIRAVIGELVGRAGWALRDPATVSQVLIDQTLKVLLWFAVWFRISHGSLRYSEPRLYMGAHVLSRVSYSAVALSA